MDKFNENLYENRNVLTYSLHKRFKIWLMNEELYDLVLYSKVETRGFLVSIEGVEYVCLKEIVLGGVRKIHKR